MLKKIDLLCHNSASIGPTNFVKQKTFVSLLIDHVLTATCSKSIRIATISFAASSQLAVEFDFDNYSRSVTPCVDLKNAVNGIAYVHWWATNTARALEEGHSLVNDASRGARSDAEKVVFVLTDGRSNQGGKPGPKLTLFIRNTDGAKVIAMGVANLNSKSIQNDSNAITETRTVDHKIGGGGCTNLRAVMVPYILNRRTSNNLLEEAIGNCSTRDCT